jgi:hypothetical protein
MTHDIAFLHTSSVHPPHFDRLMAELAPGCVVSHTVREDLLALAQQRGVAHAPLVGQVREALARAARGGARMVVCTCSTIGDLAESQDDAAGLRVTRIDRAMADEAVRAGGRVLLVAALQSTLQPTAELLQSSARRAGTTVLIESLWVQSAWPHFLAGRLADYAEAIVRAVATAPRGGTIVLAQASMAPAAERLARQGILALTSPRLGVAHALRLWAEASARPPS